MLGVSPAAELSEGVSPGTADLLVGPLCPGLGVSPAAATAYETRAPLPLPGKGVSPVTANLLAGWLWPGRLKRCVPMATVVGAKRHAHQGHEAQKV